MDQSIISKPFPSYPEFVASLVKPPAAIISTLNADKVDLIHAVLGVSGEAGELLDAIKKFVIYNKNLDLENVIEELGDLEFYMEQLRQRLGVTRAQCITANMKKLQQRYEKGYSDKAAAARADKVGSAQ